MKIKSYAFRFAAALATFGLAIGLIGVGRWLQNVWQIKPPQISAMSSNTEKKTAEIPPIVRKAETELSKAEETVADSEYQFDGEGEYYIPGEPPKHFKEFGMIRVETRDWEDSSDEFPYGKPFPPKGYVFHKEKFLFKRIGIANRQIAFETESVKGISYKFVGKFLDEMTRDVALEANISLEGRLTKMHDGKKIAEARVRLAVDESCSC